MAPLQILALALAVCVCHAARFTRKADRGGREHPHVVLVMADDVGWSGVGYSAKRAVQQKQEKGESIKMFEAEQRLTPNMDRLATEQGVVLTRHYSYTFCTPTRQAFMSGRLPVRLGPKLSYHADWDGGVDPVWGYDGLPLVQNGSSIARKFKEAGYYTAIVGKADGHGSSTPEHHPKARGWDESLVMMHHATDNWHYGAAEGSIPCFQLGGNRVMDFWENDGPWKPAREMSQKNNTENPDGGVGIHKEVIYLERVKQIIQEHARERPSQSLFLKYATTLGHTPLQSDKRFLEATGQMMCDWNANCQTARGQCSLSPDVWQGPKGRCALEERVNYLAHIHMMDAHIGEVETTLKAAKMWDDTVFVFVSDNGGGTGRFIGGNNWPLYGGKGADWEGGMRTLAFVSGGFLPGEARGREMNQVMHVTDWYGTFLSLAGVDWSTDNLDTVVGPVDALNFWENIIGKSDREVRQELHLSHGALLQKQRNGEWLKFITGVQAFSLKTGPDYPDSEDTDRPLNGRPDSDSKPYDCNEGCLFNLDDDPEESVNLNHTNEWATAYANMGRRLATLNVEQYYEPWRGCSAEKYSCAVARNRYDDTYGPFINVGFSESVNDEYFQKCEAEPYSDDCIPKSRNKCNCITSQWSCNSDSKCSWNRQAKAGDPKCDLS